MAEHKHSSAQEPESMNRIEVRLARTEAEVEASLKLRYDIFYQENGAKKPENLQDELDKDRYDDIAEHLIVIDKSIEKGSGGIVGTYRLLPQDIALKEGGFYTSGEYDITPLLNSGTRTLELGRSCVLPEYRTRHIIQKLWAGISEYVTENDIGLLFGCASIPGTDIDKISKQLAYLYHYHLAPEDIRPIALENRYVDMHLHDKESIDKARVFASLPPLFKGYLRIGSCVGDGAVIDHDFNTTDVCMILSTQTVTDRYKKHYERRNKTSLPTGGNGRDSSRPPAQQSGT